MRGLPIACLVVGSLLPVGAQEIQLDDDFSSYPEGSDGAPTWASESLGWEVRGGQLAISGPMNIAHMAQQPRFARITVEATLVLDRAVIAGWKVAGVCLYSDPRNFWYMGLVEAPDNLEKRHYCELTEMRDGAWLAQSNLRTLVSEGSALQWQYGTPYRLRISMTPDGIEGQVVDMNGARLAHIAYAFDGPAVTLGRPALRACGFEGTFDDIHVTASNPAAQEPAQEKAYPPYSVISPGPFTSQATGFFRTAQRDGRWWIVDPLGHAFYAIGTDHCRYEGHWCQKLGYAPYGRKNAARWQSREEWAVRATQRLRSWGFNLLGAGHGPECRYQGLAHTEFIALGSAFAAYDDLCPQVHWTGFPNVFSPKWPTFCDRRAGQVCAELRGDPWLLGYFLDNELEWYGKTGSEGGLFDEAMKKPATHTGKQALLRFLQSRYATVADFNEAWGVKLESFDAILTRDALTGTNQDAVRADKTAFVRLVAEEYFKHATAAIRKHDPNHLILGCRFAGNAPAGIWDIAGKYCDIVTFNSYDRVDLERGLAPGLVERFTGIYEQAQKPLMVTEWSFPALDSGLPCKHGAGMRVDTQTQRAECFRIYQEMLFRLPFMVGSDFFMWVDEPALGISDTFPEDSNYGLVNEDDEPYPELTAMATRVNAMVHELHSGQYPEIGLGDGPVVFNRGKAAATFTLVTSVDGQRRQEETALGPGEEKVLDLKWEPTPGGHLLMAEVDPERRTADGDRGNNRWVQTRWVEGLRLPENLTGRPAAAVVVANGSNAPAASAIAHLRTSQLPWPPESMRGRSLAVWDLDGRPVASQLDPPELLIQAGDLAPWQCRTLVVTLSEAGPGGEMGPAVEWGASAVATWLDNGRLRLEGDTRSTGNVFDRILLDGVLLGSYNPLIWQEVDGQDLWVAASATHQPGAPGRAVAAVCDVVCSGGQRRAITTVDDQGLQAPQRTQPVGFEVSHRIVVYPNQSWFLTRLNYVKNISDRPLTLKGYFFYLYGAIGGEKKGDRPAEPGVPNYYDWAGAAWQDDETGLVFGVVPLDHRIEASFWLDGGGNQHPDARRELRPPVVLQPGEMYQDEDRPWLLVYGGKAQEKPWQAMRRVAEQLKALQVTVHEVRWGSSGEG